MYACMFVGKHDCQFVICIHESSCVKVDTHACRTTCTHMHVSIYICVCVNLDIHKYCKTCTYVFI